LTVQAGVICLSSGDTLEIKPGTYDEGNIGSNAASEIPSGTSWLDVTTIKAFDPDNRPIIKPTSNPFFIFDLRKSGSSKIDSYIVLDGLILDGSNDNTIGIAEGGSLVSIKIGSHHIRVIRSHLRNTGDGVSCVQIQDGGVGLVNGFNEFIDNEISGCGGNLGDHGLYFDAYSDNVVRGNDFHNISGRCIRSSRAFRQRLENNLCHDANTGFELSADDTMVKNNIFYDITSNYVIHFKNRSGGSIVENNTIYNWTHTGSVTGAAIMFTSPDATDSFWCNGAIARNNIIQKTTSAFSGGGKGILLLNGCTNNTIENNVIFDTSGLTIDNQGGNTNTITGNLFVDPLLVDPANQNFNLQSSSPAIALGAGACPGNFACSGIVVSTKFIIGDKVQTTDILNVRSTPSISGTLLGAQSTGAQGTVIGGPIAANGFNWWQIDYDNIPDGWSAEDFLEKAIVSSLFDFSLSNTGNKSVTQGSLVTNFITALLSSGTTQAVSFSTSGLPTGATPSYSQTSCNPSCTTNLSIITTSSTPPS